MPRTANIRVERVEMSDTTDEFDIDLEDNESILRVVMTKTSRYSGGSRFLNIYILTDPVAPEDVIIGECESCGQFVTQGQTYSSDHGHLNHNNPADCEPAPISEPILNEPATEAKPIG